MYQTIKFHEQYLLSYLLSTDLNRPQQNKKYNTNSWAETQSKEGTISHVWNLTGLTILLIFVNNNLLRMGK